MLILSILSLLLGPVVYEFGRARPAMRQFLDGIVFTTIAGIVFFHIIPEVIEAGGAIAIVFLLLGLAFPVLLEHRFHDAVPQAHGFILVLAALGIVVHAAIDGVALVPTAEGGFWRGNELAVSVVLHRLPVGMALWWSVRPNFGKATAYAVFALIISATIVAYVAAEPVMALAAASSVAWFQAFVSGSLIHVAAFGTSHEHADEGEPRRQGWAYRAGILTGLFLLVTLPGLSLLAD